MNVIITVASVAAAAVLAFLIGYLMRKKTAEAKFKSAEEEVKKILENAYKEADSKKKEALVEAFDLVYGVEITDKMYESCYALCKGFDYTKE